MWTPQLQPKPSYREDTHISDDDRIIFAKFTLPAEPDLLPLYVLNLYAPADSPPQSRTVFYNQLMVDYIKSVDSYGDILERLILAGDFNFQYDLRFPDNEPRKRPSAFVAFTDTFFHDCNNNYSDPLFETLPTFRRGKAIKTLDYIMVGRQLKDSYFDNDIEYIAPTWTDHALLTIKMRLHLTNTGKGLWRANPNLAHYKSYVKKIKAGISHFMQHILVESTDSSQIKCDRLKGYVRKLTKAYCSNRASWRRERLKQLQSSRKQLMRRLKDDDQEALQQHLPAIEQFIAHLEHGISLNATLKAGRRWLDHNNENSVGFLKKTSERRLAQRTMDDTITHPTTSVPCSSTADNKLEAVHDYYDDVWYSPEPTHRYSIDKLLKGIQTTISVDDAEYIIAAIDMEDILKSANRCPKISSPGKDGLPYRILRLILAHPACKDLALNAKFDIRLEKPRQKSSLKSSGYCIRNLFFKTKIVINVNGLMTEPVAQKRGLRQGDSISPVLFNFALEPLLLAILNDEKIKRYSVNTRRSKRLRCNWWSLLQLSYWHMLITCWSSSTI
ncbi:unnamed protein product [Mucor circinelloides]